MKDFPDKCKRCGAPINWDGSSQSVKCDFCSKIYTASSNLKEKKDSLLIKHPNRFRFNRNYIIITSILITVISLILIGINFKRSPASKTNSSNSERSTNIKNQKAGNIEQEMKDCIFSASKNPSSMNMPAKSIENYCDCALTAILVEGRDIKGAGYDCAKKSFN